MRHAPCAIWHDDGQDEDEANQAWGGPNGSLSLRQAQANFARLGAINERVTRFVRKPEPDEI